MILTIVLTTILAQGVPARSGLDFPPSDQRVWQLQDAERVRQEAERLAGGPLSADRVRSLLQLNRVDEALDSLLQLVAAKPIEATTALRGLGAGQHFSDGARDYSPKLGAIFSAARARAAALPKEDAALLEFAVADGEGNLRPGSDAWEARTAALLARYAGTRAATLAQMRRLPYGPMTARLDALDAIAREHPGTDIAAAAIYQKGFDLAYNAFVTGRDRQPDPTERFQRVLAIVEELESGRYPKGEWTEKAPQLVIQFNVYKPEYSAEHIDTMIDGYRAFLKTHFAVDLLNPFANSYGYVITTKMAELFKLKGDADGVDRILRELEADSPDRDGAAFLRAMQGGSAQDRIARLEALVTRRDHPYAAKALATLALDDLREGRAAQGRARLLQFLERYPRSEYAWLATLHAAEALALQGDWVAASAEFMAVAAKYPDTAMAVILGRVLSGHAAEASGQPARALDHYTTALAAWPRETYAVSLYTSRQAPEFRRNDLAQRAARLRASLAHPGGDLLERGRWELANGERDKAILTLQGVVKRFAASPVHSEATLLLHRAQLEAALDLANVERADGDPAAAAARIEELAREPLDSATVAARIAVASKLWLRGDAEAARRTMTTALTEWLKAQPQHAPTSELDTDVAEIRDAVFRPLGDGIYAGRPRWNAFEWPKAVPRFLLVDPEIQVTTSTGDVTPIVVARPLPAYSNVVSSDKTMTALLDRIVVTLGGTKRRQPTEIMETPNQPVGESMRIIAFWNEFFPARPGHWGGYEFTSYPRITRIRFLDAARTRAAADVTIGYSGVTVLLEKRGLVWTPVKLTNEWIT